MVLPQNEPTNKSRHLSKIGFRTPLTPLRAPPFSWAAFAAESYDRRRDLYECSYYLCLPTGASRGPQFFAGSVFCT